MRTSTTPHWDVAAYALGVLDTRESALFEEHLTQCVSCAVELESLLPVTAALAEVDREAFLGAEQSQRRGRMLDQMVNVVAFDRSRTHARRLLAAAAGTVAILLLVGLSAFAGTVWSGRSNEAVAPAPTATGSAGPGGSRPATAPGTGGPGVGGVEGPPPDEVFESTSATTGVNVKLGLSSAAWGTAVSLELSSVRGPLTCQLVALGPGGSEVVSTWKVPPDGYGTPKHPDPVFLEASTAVSRDSIDRFEVRTASSTGESKVLVSLNV